jgi:hypothetical protein
MFYVNFTYHKAVCSNRAHHKASSCRDAFHTFHTIRGVRVRSDIAIILGLSAPAAAKILYNWAQPTMFYGYFTYVKFYMGF